LLMLQLSLRAVPHALNFSWKCDRAFGNGEEGGWVDEWMSG
jgi:hypothetical protein